MEELGSRALVLDEECGIEYKIGIDLATKNGNDYSAAFIAGRRIGKTTTALAALSAEIELQNQSVPMPNFNITRQTPQEGFEILNRDPVARQRMQDNAIRQMQQEEDEAIFRDLSIARGLEFTDISIVSQPTDPVTRVMESTPRSTQRLFDTEPIRVGARAGEVLESGYFYAPYIPLQSTPAVSIRDTMEAFKGKIVCRSIYVLGDRILDMG